MRTFEKDYVFNAPVLKSLRKPSRSNRIMNMIKQMDPKSTLFMLFAANSKNLSFAEVCYRYYNSSSHYLLLLANTGFYKTTDNINKFIIYALFENHPDFIVARRFELLAYLDKPLNYLFNVYKSNKNYYFYDFVMQRALYQIYDMPNPQVFLKLFTKEDVLQKKKNIFAIFIDVLDDYKMSIKCITSLYTVMFSYIINIDKIIFFLLNYSYNYLLIKKLYNLTEVDSSTVISCILLYKKYVKDLYSYT